MKRYFIMLLIFPMLFLNIFAEQGKYIRKSISSVESVWIAPNAIQAGMNLDTGFFQKMIKFYIENPRFDYNQVPESMLTDFRRQVNSISSPTPDQISQILANTVGARIKEILNDPDIQKLRGENIKDEAALMSFAATKGKSKGLTYQEIETLMNSAFIYLPYVNSLTLETKENTNNVTINGGIIWYQVKIASNGSVAVVQRVAASSMGMGASKNGDKDYKHFSFGDETMSCNEIEYAQYDAVQAFVRNLGVKTKQIDEFKLSAQITEVKGKTYGFNLGHREGIFLDDGFDLVEYVEKDDGSTALNNVGFARIIKTADNNNDPNANSYARQYIGSRRDIGTVVMERPRLGLDIVAKAGFLTGMMIKKDYSPSIGGADHLYNDDATSALVFDLQFDYNIAPIIGSTQTFMYIDLGFGLPVVDYNEDATATTSYIASAYLGFDKKFWFERSNIKFGIGGGYDRFSTKATYFTDDLTYSVNAFGVKANAECEYLVTPDLSFLAGIGYKFGFRPTSVSLEYQGNTYSYSGSEVGDVYPDLQLGGFNINAGFSYSISSLPFNLFGFLDPLKKY